MSEAAALFARWRVRLGYFLAVFVLWFAKPTPRSIVVGAIVGAAGLCIRAYAAGYLRKQSMLTVTGPYAYMRNPLYFGSSVLALGAGIATRSWICATILVFYFTLVYAVVMRREEQELFVQHGDAFKAYAAAVPLFFPRMTSAKLQGVSAGSFSLSQYKKNHEYEAAIGFLLLLLVFLLKWHFWPR
jgi:protein-S-isoprenylcysteine O-methyltransferase Ste14